jgi:hypothetical protein
MILTPHSYREMKKTLQHCNPSITLQSGAFPIIVIETAFFGNRKIGTGCLTTALIEGVSCSKPQHKYLGRDVGIGSIGGDYLHISQSLYRLGFPRLRLKSIQLSEDKTMSEHRTGINPGFLIKHTISLSGLNESNVAVITTELDHLPYVDSVCIGRDKQTIKIAYDASHHGVLGTFPPNVTLIAVSYG